MVTERLAERGYEFESRPGMMYPSELMMSNHPPPLQPLHRGLPPPPIPLPLHHQVHQRPPLTPEERFSGASSPRGRRQREFIPESKKDDCYWDRRRRNNEAAKRSREKRRLNDLLLERRVLELTKENWILKAQIRGVFDSYGIRAEETLSGVAVDRILASMPSNEQILAFGNRSNSRRDLFDFDNDTPDSRYSDDGPTQIKRPKLEIPDAAQASPDRWSSASPHASVTAPKSEDDIWCREDDETSRPPTRQETDDWGALNLTSGGSSSNSSSDAGYEACTQSTSDNPTTSFTFSPRSTSSSSFVSHSSPVVIPMSHLLPHKLRFKHSLDEHLSPEESDENSG